MRLMSHNILGMITAAVLVGTWIAPASVYAQNAVLDEDDSALDPDSPANEKLLEPSVEYGLGLRLRRVHLPESMLELLFFNDVPGSEAHVGLGLELIRKRGNFTISLGFEYESIAAAEGVWVDKGDEIPTNDPDRVEFEDFRWLTLDFTFAWQAEISKIFSIRYGLGIGAGYILGDVLRTDLLCTTDNPDSCAVHPQAELIQTPESDVPPFFPVFNLIVGVQFRPISKLAINLEGGLRTVPFFGTTVAYMF